MSEEATNDAPEQVDAPLVEVTLFDDPPAPTVEDIASEKGWRPKDQWKGPEEGWRSAADFLRKTPDNRELKREMRELREQNNRMAGAFSKQTEKALKAQADELNARFQEAVENKDTAGAAAAVKDMRSLEKEMSETKPQDRNYEEDFAAENPWYGKDDAATAYAVSVAQKAHAAGKSPEEQLEMARVAVEKRFPDLTDTPAPKVRTLNAPSRNVTAPRAKGYADLSAEAKRGIDQFARTIAERHGKSFEATQKELAADYWAEQAA